MYKGNLHTDKMTWAERVKCVVEKRRDVRSLDR